MTTLLRTTARPPGERCRHDALDFVGNDLWRYRLCRKVLTDMELLKEKQARHLKNKTPDALTPGGTARNTKEQPALSIPQLPLSCKGVL